MWTPGEWYSRNALRYQSDVTDKEWHVIEPLFLRDRREDGRADGRCGRSSTRFFTSCDLAALGGFFLPTCRHGAYFERIYLNAGARERSVSGNRWR
jgi:hypothetical protein